MDKIENTFVTPVFNGSASVRDASGQLIENVTKATRRGETVNAFHIQRLYSEVISLHRLNQFIGGSQEELGALPSAAVALLVAFAVCWSCIGIYVIIDKVKKKKLKNP